jgi:hypothetical protein
MIGTSFESAWRDEWVNEERSFREIDAYNDDAFRNWNRNCNPEIETADQFFLATDILYSQGDRELALRFLRQAIAVADRAFAEDKFRKSKWCRPGFPKNRGEAEKIRVYAKALLGEKFEPIRIRRAAEDILSWWRENADWSDAMMQADWLTALRMSLIAGDPAWTRELVAEAMLMNFYRAEVKRMDDVARAALEHQPIRDAALRKRIDERFDTVRSPKWKGRGAVGEPFEDVRFELAVVRHRYFISKDGTIDWDAVIESIRR